MIDFYRKSILSQAGKDAGNKTTPDFLRWIQEKYPEFTAKIKSEREKKPEEVRENYDLYL